MKRLPKLAVALALLAGPAQAITVERACLSSDRKAVSRPLCSCIQQAANLTLNGADQALVATFFRDPDKAQEIRASNRRAHEQFWERYQAFAATAEQFCRAG